EDLRPRPTRCQSPAPLRICASRPTRGQGLAMMAVIGPCRARRGVRRTGVPFGPTSWHASLVRHAEPSRTSRMSNRRQALLLWTKGSSARRHTVPRDLRSVVGLGFARKVYAPPPRQPPRCVLVCLPLRLLLRGELWQAAGSPKQSSSCEHV